MTIILYFNDFFVYLIHCTYINYYSLFLHNVIKDNQWAIGTTVGGEDIQRFTSVGVRQIGINNTLERVLQNNQTYYVSIRCINGGEQVTQWNDSIGKLKLK